MKIIKNSIVNRFEIVQDSAVAYFQQISEQLKAKYDTWTIINILGKKIVYRIGKFIPNYEDVIRRFTKQEDNTLIDSISSNDAAKILPVSVFNGVDGRVDTPTRIDSKKIGRIKALVLLSSDIDSSSVAECLVGLEDTEGVFTGGWTGALLDEILSIGTSGTTQWRVAYSSDTEKILAGIHLLDIMWTGDTYEIYLDEVRKDNVITGTPTLIDAADIRFGARTYGANFFNGGLFDIEVYDELDNEIYNIPLPHLPYGFDSSNNPIPLTVSGGVSKGYDINGSSYLQDKGNVVKSNGDVIPNTPTGQATLEPIDNDIFIAGGGMMNLTDCLVRLYEVGDVDVAKTFFDKSNALIWKQTVRDSIYYDASNTGDWHTSELTQQYIYDNIQDAYKYQLWSKVNSLGIFKDIFLYPVSLGIEDAVKAGKYVGNPVVIPYEVTEGNYQVTEGDYLVTP